MKENNPRVVEVDEGGGVSLLSDEQRRVVALGLVMTVLSGPMISQVRAESNLSSPLTTVTESGEMPSQETILVTDKEKHQIQDMVMDFGNVDSMDLPYDKIENLLKQDDDKKYEVYRQELREIGCTNEDEIYICAKWKYGLDFFYDGIVNNSKADENYARLETYVTHEQINHYALTGEGLNVYRDDEGKSKFLLVHTDKKADKAFRAAIDSYKKDEAKNVVEVLSDMGFCIWFPYVFNENTGYGMGLFDWKTGVIHQNADANSIKKFKDEGLKNAIVSLLVVESMGSAHGRVMDCLTDPDGTRRPGGFTFGTVDLEVVKSLMGSFNWDFLFEQTGNKIYKVFSEDARLMADDYAKRFGKNVNDPFILRQLEMMTLGGLTKPLGADNWDFAKEKIEELKGK